MNKVTRRVLILAVLFAVMRLGHWLVRLTARGVDKLEGRG